MSINPLREAYILYGSQTGNGESIAEDLYSKCKGLGIRCKCQTLDSMKKVNLKEEVSAIFVVISTTGNGDSPENSDGFWRMLKARKNPKDLLEGIPFGVMGLGDTNYDKFCHMGKSMDRRLHELGGVRLFDMVCADEVEGMEMFVRKFHGLVIPLLKEAYSPMVSAAAIMTRITGAHTSCTTAEINITTNDEKLGVNYVSMVRRETPAETIARITGLGKHGEAQPNADANRLGFESKPVSAVKNIDTTKEAYILYGSQTGNGESIAEDLYSKCKGLGIRCKCQTLDSMKKVNLKEEVSAIFVVISTTGNGDSPENSDGFWRMLKARKNPKDLLEGIPFGVMGLGDTNYDKFCHMGKSMDRRLHELGGVRLFDMVCADEVEGMEMFVRKFHGLVIPLLKEAYSPMVSAAAIMTRITGAHGPAVHPPTSLVGEANLESVVVVKPPLSVATMPSPLMESAEVVPHPELPPPAVPVPTPEIITAARQNAKPPLASVPKLSPAMIMAKITRAHGGHAFSNAIETAEEVLSRSGTVSGIMSFDEVVKLSTLKAETLLDPPDTKLLPKAVVKAAKFKIVSIKLDKEVISCADCNQSEVTMSGSLEKVRSLTGSFSDTSIAGSFGRGGFSGSRSFNSSSNHLAGSCAYSNINPYMAKVVYAKWLTNHSGKEGERRVLHMEISLGDSGIEYFPGDSIGICPPNPASHVEFILKMLQSVDHTDFINSHCEKIADYCSPGPGRRSSNGILDPEMVLMNEHTSEQFTIRELFTYRLDLYGGVCKKAFVLALAKACGDEADANVLKWCVSKGTEGKLLWKHFVEEQCLSIVDILKLFPSCKPSITVLLTHLSPMAPRYYSISSSPLVMCSTVSVAFSIVEYECVCSLKPKTDSRRVLRRKGLCTSYLESILQPFLSKPSTYPTTKVRIFHKPNINFRLPSSVSCPLILVGPGTGVAPFIGFLDHRAQQERDRKNFVDDAVCGVWRGEFEFDSEDLPAECNSVEKYVQEQEPGHISLFFGCRDENDYLYKDLLQKRVNDGTLTTLEVAFSRVQQHKVYVTHKIQNRADEIADLILNQQAYVYVCGDGNQMAKDVEVVLKESLINYSLKHMPANYNPTVSPFSTVTPPPAPQAPVNSLLSVAISQNVSTESLASTITTNSDGSTANANGRSIYCQPVQYQCMRWVRNVEEADEFFKDLKVRKRYCQDIWS